MAADELGNDVGAVGIPVTGRMGVAPYGTPIPTPVEGASRTLALAADFKIPGLLTEDGGFEWTMEADGDAIVFWQAGYQIPSGQANVEVVCKYAQTDETVRQIIRGKTADANGYMTIDGGGTDAKYVIFTEEIFKNGTIRRRVAPNASIKSVKEDKNTRGEVLSYEVTYSIGSHAAVNSEHIGEWLLLNPADVLSVTSALPADAAAGDSVTITGSGFSGTTGVKFGAANATSFAVVNNATLTAVLPAGTAGSAQITVTTPAGTATLPYTRG